VGSRPELLSPDGSSRSLLPGLLIDIGEAFPDRFEFGLQSVGAAFQVVLIILLCGRSSL